MQNCRKPSTIANEKTQFLCDVLRYTRDLEPKSLYDCLYRTSLYYIERCEEKKKMLSVLVSVLYDDFRRLRYSFAVTLNKSCLTRSHTFCSGPPKRNTHTRMYMYFFSKRHFYNEKHATIQPSIFIASFSIKFLKVSVVDRCHFCAIAFLLLKRMNIKMIRC